MGGKSAARRANREAARVRQEEDDRRARIQSGTEGINSTFNSQFGDGYYKGIGKAYRDYATPQVAEQHADARKQLIFDLSRTGKIDSSTRATKQGELQDVYNQRQQEIADAALTRENQARQSVEDARSNLISQLNSTGDTQGAINAASARAAALSQPAMQASPLVDLFSDFTGGLSSRYAHERAYAASGGASHARNPVVGARPGAVTVRG